MTGKKMDIVTVFDIMTPGIAKKLPANIGILYLCAVLKQAEIPVIYKDYRLTNYDNPLEIENLVSFLSDSNRILAIGCSSNILAHLIVALKQLKQRHPEKFIILGGCGPTTVAEKLVERFDFIDAVVLGEGEYTIVELVQALEQGNDLAQVKGIYFRKKGKVVKNPMRPRIGNLDSLPYPDYDVLDIKNYVIRVITTRGCPFNCTFCNIREVWQHKTVYRNIDSVIDEIKHLKQKYGREHIGISDDTFMTNKKRVLEFCRKIKQQNIKIHWGCLARADLMDEELMKVMSEAGCKQAFYGLESASDDILKKMNKPFSSKKAADTIIKSKKYFPVEVIASLIWGLPYESIQEFLDTLHLGYSLSKKDIIVMLHLICIYPNTKTYEDYKDRLKFSEEIIPILAMPHIDKKTHKALLVTKKIIVNSTVKGHFQSEEVLQLIKENPEIFPQYYYIESPILERKRKIMELFVMVRRLDLKGAVFVFDDYTIIMDENRYLYLPKSKPDYKDKVREYADSKCMLGKQGFVPTHVFFVKDKELLVPDSLLEQVSEIKKQGLGLGSFDLSKNTNMEAKDKCETCRYKIRRQCSLALL